MKDKTLRDRNGVEIREGCTLRTKALSNGRQVYECFNVVRVRNRLSVRKKDPWGNLRTYSVEYILRWMGDDSMEVVDAE